MLRISRAPTASTGPERLRLEGRIAGPWVEELRRVCADVLNGGGRGLVLDLSGISFVDPEGVALCRELAAHHVACINGSAFVAEQLKGVADVTR